MSWDKVDCYSGDIEAREHRQLREALKNYLGYPPYNTPDNTNKRNPVFAAYLERLYGRKISELLKKAGMKDFGETPPPKEKDYGPQAARIKALINTYELNGLYFWREWVYSDAWQCSFKYNDKCKDILYIDLKSFLSIFSGERKAMRKYGAIFQETGNKHYSLDDLRKEILLMRLSGIIGEK